MDMTRIPHAFWVLLIAVQGASIAVIVLFAPSTDNIKLAVLAIGASLVSGALGAFTGHAMATASQKPVDPSKPGTTSSTSTSA